MSYKIKSGDTLESISRKQYGSEFYADLISDANPGLGEPLTSGVEIVIPNNPDFQGTSIAKNIYASSPSEVSILIDGKRFRFWESVRITRSVDTISTVELLAPFDSDTPGFKETFRPFSYKPVSVSAGGDLFFTGTMIGVTPVIEPRKKSISVSCYAKPGVLNDCTPPASMFSGIDNKLFFNNQGLKSIAKTLARPSGISVVFQADQGAIFEKVSCAPEKKILPFLAGLAQQRNLIISSTPEGALLFSKTIESGETVANLKQGTSPVLSVHPTFSPQEYYSHITGREPVVIGLSGSQFTVKNPRLSGVIRPYTYTVTDTQCADVKTAVKAKVGRMFGNMVAYSVKVATWRDPSGNLWEPNTIVSLDAPDAMVYRPYDFVIRGVEFERDSRKEHATLDLVMPGSFSGEIPEALPWDESTARFNF